MECRSGQLTLLPSCHRCLFVSPDDLGFGVESPRAAMWAHVLGIRLLPGFSFLLLLMPAGFLAGHPSSSLPTPQSLLFWSLAPNSQLD